MSCACCFAEEILALIDKLKLENQAQASQLSEKAGLIAHAVSQINSMTAEQAQLKQTNQSLYQELAAVKASVGAEVTAAKAEGSANANSAAAQAFKEGMAHAMSMIKEVKQMQIF